MVTMMMMMTMMMVVVVVVNLLLLPKFVIKYRPWTTPKPDFKVRPFFDAEYLRTG